MESLRTVLFAFVSPSVGVAGLGNEVDAVDMRAELEVEDDVLARTFLVFSQARVLLY